MLMFVSGLDGFEVNDLMNLGWRWKGLDSDHKQCMMACRYVTVFICTYLIGAGLLIWLGSWLDLLPVGVQKWEEFEIICIISNLTGSITSRVGSIIVITSRRCSTCTKHQYDAP